MGRWCEGRGTDLGVVLYRLVETVVVRVDDLVDYVLDKVALLFEELDLAVTVLGGKDVYDVRQRVETRRRPSLVDPRQPFFQVLHARTCSQTPNSKSISQFQPRDRAMAIWKGAGLTDLSAGIGRPSKMPRRWRFIVPTARRDPAAGEARDLERLGREDRSRLQSFY
jgi:hypothetical protein